MFYKYKIIITLIILQNHQCFCGLIIHEKQPVMFTLTSNE